MDPRSVLVVTDIDLAGWALRHALTSAGFLVLTAGDADAARAVIEASDPFDVLVVSLSLGAECVGALLDHSSRLWPAVPAIVLAVDPEPSALQTRAVHVILEKPYTVANVVALAGRFCGASEGLTLPSPSTARPFAESMVPGERAEHPGGGRDSVEQQAPGSQHQSKPRHPAGDGADPRTAD
jgi:DNA-binding NtrC family response regulator